MGMMKRLYEQSADVTRLVTDSEIRWAVNLGLPKEIIKARTPMHVSLKYIEKIIEEEQAKQTEYGKILYD